jgi:hypothetical protein
MGVLKIHLRQEDEKVSKTVDQSNGQSAAESFIRENQYWLKTKFPGCTYLSSGAVTGRRPVVKVRGPMRNIPVAERMARTADLRKMALTVGCDVLVEQRNG